MLLTGRKSVPFEHVLMFIINKRPIFSAVIDNNNAILYQYISEWSV